MIIAATTTTTITATEPPPRPASRVVVLVRLRVGDDLVVVVVARSGVAYERAVPRPPRRVVVVVDGDHSLTAAPFVVRLATHGRGLVPRDPLLIRAFLEVVVVVVVVVVVGVQVRPGGAELVGGAAEASPRRVERAVGSRLRARRVRSRTDPRDPRRRTRRVWSRSTPKPRPRKKRLAEPSRHSLAQRRRARPPRLLLGARRASSSVALTDRHTIAAAAAADLRASALELLALRSGELKHGRGPARVRVYARGDEVVRHGLPPELQRLVRELLRREQVTLRAQAVGAAAVADVAAHRAAPLVVRQRLRDVLAHAHLQAPAAPHAAPPAAGRRLAPLAALAPRLDVGCFLAAEVATRALAASRAVHILAPHLRAARIPRPGTPPAVQPVVVLERVVLGVLALRGAQLRELGADLARIDPGHVPGRRRRVRHRRAQHLALLVVHASRVSHIGFARVAACRRGRGGGLARGRRGRADRRGAASVIEKTVASHPRRGFAHASPQRLVLHVREVVVLGEVALRVGERDAATRHGRSRGRAGRVPLAFRRVCLRLKNRWVPTTRASNVMLENRHVPRATDGPSARRDLG